MHPDPAVTFLQEAEDLLAEIEAAALTINSQPVNMETINHIFRAFHTIKGSGSMFGFDQVASFTHYIETLLDQVREGTVPVTEQLCTIILAASDQIRMLLFAAQTGTPVDPTVQEVLLETVRQISQPTSQFASSRSATSNVVLDAPTVWKIEFRPSQELLSRAGNPFLLFRDLNKLGCCTIRGNTSNIPALPEMEPECCYLWWSMELIAKCSEDDIRDVFLFVAEEHELLISKATDPAPLQVTAPPVEEGSAPKAASVTPAPKSQAVATSAVSTPAPTEVPATVQAASGREATVRVPAERLDRLVNLIGELVMNQSRLARVASTLQSSELAGPVEEIDRLVSELRDDVLQIRMMPIGTIFGRFRRLVRDLSLQLGKQIELETEGEETEMDKSILDLLSEPLVHLIRNSLDHGIETSAEREAVGKSPRGTIRLVALHRGSDVVVSITDDGKGLNRDAIRQKAISKQLISPDASLTDKEILNLILLPGFSTAATITSISGRGVGMDVVKRQIDALRGSLSITSEVGKGTCVSLTLPLTLAIIDGLSIETADSQYIVPMALVTENVELRQSERLLNNGRNMIAVRGDLIPYIDLREHFHISGDAPEISKIVIVRHEDKRVGLVVDRVLGTHQTVIQALGRFFRNIGVVSGSTVMGDGRVALILDVPGIVQHVESKSKGLMAA